MTKTIQDITEILQYCPVCSNKIEWHPGNPLVLRCCSMHGYFVIPVETEQALRWEFLSVCKNRNDEFLMGRLLYCPTCKGDLELNTKWRVKNCTKLHGDFQVRQGITTFSYDEPDYAPVSDA